MAAILTAERTSRMCVGAPAKHRQWKDARQACDRFSNGCRPGMSNSMGSKQQSSAKMHCKVLMIMHAFAELYWIMNMSVSHNN